MEVLFGFLTTVGVFVGAFFSYLHLKKPIPVEKVSLIRITGTNNVGLRIQFQQQNVEPIRITKISVVGAKIPTRFSSESGRWIGRESTKKLSHVSKGAVYIPPTNKDPVVLVLFVKLELNARFLKVCIKDGWIKEYEYSLPLTKD